MGVAIRYMAHDYKGATWSVRNQRKQSEIPSVEMVERVGELGWVCQNNSLKKIGKVNWSQRCCALLISMGSSHKSSKRSFPLKQRLNFPAFVSALRPSHSDSGLLFSACTTGGFCTFCLYSNENQPKSICVLLKFVTTTVHAECFAFYKKCLNN